MFKSIRFMLVGVVVFLAAPSVFAFTLSPQCQSMEPFAKPIKSYKNRLTGTVRPAVQRWLPPKVIWLEVHTSIPQKFHSDIQQTVDWWNEMLGYKKFHILDFNNSQPVQSRSAGRSDVDRSNIIYMSTEQDDGYDKSFAPKNKGEARTLALTVVDTRRFRLGGWAGDAVDVLPFVEGSNVVVEEIVAADIVFNGRGPKWYTQAEWDSKAQSPALEVLKKGGPLSIEEALQILDKHPDEAYLVEGRTELQQQAHASIVVKLKSPAIFSVVLAHELGHMLGLQHMSEHQDSIMNPAVLQTKPVLEPVDLQYVKCLYPEFYPAESQTQAQGDHGLQDRAGSVASPAPAASSQPTSPAAPSDSVTPIASTKPVETAEPLVAAHSDPSKPGQSSGPSTFEDLQIVKDQRNQEQQAAKTALNDFMMQAIRDNNLEKVKLFIQSGADVSYVSPQRETPIQLARRLGHTEIVEFLVTQVDPAEAVKKWLSDLWQDVVDATGL